MCQRLKPEPRTPPRSRDLSMFAVRGKRNEEKHENSPNFLQLRRFVALHLNNFIHHSSKYDGVYLIKKRNRRVELFCNMRLLIAQVILNDNNLFVEISVQW